MKRVKNYTFIIFVYILSHLLAASCYEEDIPDSSSQTSTNYDMVALDVANFRRYGDEEVVIDEQVGPAMQINNEEVVHTAWIEEEDVLDANHIFGDQEHLNNVPIEDDQVVTGKEEVLGDQDDIEINGILKNQEAIDVNEFIDFLEVYEKNLPGEEGILNDQEVIVEESMQSNPKLSDLEEILKKGKIQDEKHNSYANFLDDEKNIFLDNTVYYYKISEVSADSEVVVANDLVGDDKKAIRVSTNILPKV